MDTSARFAWRSWAKKRLLSTKNTGGGVCLNVGCIPSKALIYAGNQYHKMTHEANDMGLTVGKVSVDATKLQAWKSTVVKKLTGGIGGLFKSNKVEAFKGTAVFKDAQNSGSHP